MAGRSPYRIVCLEGNQSIVVIGMDCYNKNGDVTDNITVYHIVHNPGLHLNLVLWRLAVAASGRASAGLYNRCSAVCSRGMGGFPAHSPNQNHDSFIPTR